MRAAFITTSKSLFLQLVNIIWNRAGGGGRRFLRGTKNAGVDDAFGRHHQLVEEFAEHRAQTIRD